MDLSPDCRSIFDIVNRSEALQRRLKRIRKDKERARPSYVKYNSFEFRVFEWDLPGPDDTSAGHLFPLGMGSIARIPQCL
jgi:hypothetical protein